MWSDDEYIYFTDDLNIHPSAYILSKSPYPSTFGTSLWLNVSRREWRKLTQSDAIKETAGIDNDPEYQQIKKKLDKWQSEQDKKCYNKYNTVVQ